MTATQKTYEGPAIAGDGSRTDLQNPFHITLSTGMAGWLACQEISFAFTTYTLGKVVVIGPGASGRLSVSERKFGHAMAMRATDGGLYLSTKNAVWRFQNGLDRGTRMGDWDRIFMPRDCHVTGAVDIHDLHIDRERRLLAAVTQYNCLAVLDGAASFSPVWRPAFIDGVFNQDRCHFNGFCLEDGRPAYGTVIGPSNIADGWKRHRAEGGQVIDMRTDETVVDGLAMPHTPRLHRGVLYLLEAGSGWFGRVDRDTGRFERLLWCPGFLRGLTFHHDFAFIALSKPRNKVFSGLPLDAELSRQGRAPECAVYVVRLSDFTLCHTLTITGAVEEIYDTAVLTGTRQPMLVGLEGDEISKYVAVGPDASG